MLRRAALRSFQLQQAPQISSPILRANFSTSRFLAKSKGHRRPVDHRQSTIPQHESLPHKSSAASDAKTAEFPTPPSVEESFREAAKATRDESKTQDEYSETQVEFDTSSESQGNTEAHSSEQKPTHSPGRSDSEVLEHTESTEHLQASPSSQQNQHSQPLPDLTQGIPSTLDAELEYSQRQASASGERGVTVDATNVSSRRGGGDDLPKTAYITSQDRRKERLFKWMYSIVFGSALAGIVFAGRNWESLEEEHTHADAPNGWGVMLFYNRAKARIFDTTSYFNEPAFPKLLPTPDPTWERPYTLVLSLEDLLVHSEWSREHGWRMAKRPGVDYFLRYLSQYYEIVIFTSLPSMQGDAIIRKLDPYRIVMWPLFREATRYTGGQYVKVRLLLLHCPVHG